MGFGTAAIDSHLATTKQFVNQAAGCAFYERKQDVINAPTVMNCAQRLSAYAATVALLGVIGQWPFARLFQGCYSLRRSAEYVNRGLSCEKSDSFGDFRLVSRKFSKPTGCRIVRWSIVMVARQVAKRRHPAPSPIIPFGCPLTELRNW